MNVTVPKTGYGTPEFFSCAIEACSCGEYPKCDGEHERFFTGQIHVRVGSKTLHVCRDHYAALQIVLQAGE